MAKALDKERIRATWQPYYEKRLSDDDVFEIKNSVNQLLKFFSKWAASKNARKNTASESKEA